MSHFEELSFNEKEAIEQLKKNVYEELEPGMENDTNMFLRFLRARDFNLNKSEEMLRKHLTWRRANNISKILTDYEPPKVLVKYVPTSFIGFDKDGTLVRYWAFSDMDAKGVLKAVKKTTLLYYIAYLLESDLAKIKEENRKLGKNNYQWVHIFNFQDYSLAKATHKPTLDTLVALFSMYESNYPERLKAAYALNASIYFTIAYSVIKPLLSGATVSKISIYGRDGWKDVLRNTIPLDVLPAFLGGRKTDPDGNPMCKTFIKQGLNVPAEYYIVKCKNTLMKEPEVKKISVSRLSKVHIIIEVAEPNSTIEWEFEMACKDIAFGIYYKERCDDESKTKEMIPKQRVDTEISSEIGMYLCKRPGTYIMVFDNSYSWISQKEIYCRAYVVTPDGQRLSVF